MQDCTFSVRANCRERILSVRRARNEEPFANSLLLSRRRQTHDTHTQMDSAAARQTNRNPPLTTDRCQDTQSARSTLHTTMRKGQTTQPIRIQQRPTKGPQQQSIMTTTTGTTVMSQSLGAYSATSGKGRVLHRYDNEKRLLAVTTYTHVLLFQTLERCVFHFLLWVFTETEQSSAQDVNSFSLSG